MSDPRNAAHDKRVAQEKKHHATGDSHDLQASPTAGKKEGEHSHDAPEAKADEGAAQSPLKMPPAELEGSLAVLAKLKEMEFHSRANVERLAEMMMTVGDKLKQKDFAEIIGEIYSAQDALQAKLLTAIDAYKAECDRMQSPST
jgi:hypothetical protein